MNLKTVTIADLKPHPKNPNTHPGKQIDALGESLDEFDQVKNVVIWNGTILAGHALVTAAIKSGRLTLEAVDVSHWDEAKATAFMLADIRLPDNGIFQHILYYMLGSYCLSSYMPLPQNSTKIIPTSNRS